MSLGQKTLAIVFLTVVGLMVVLYATTRTLMIRSFLDLEEQGTKDAVERAENALNDDISDLSKTANDYGIWDRMYSYMQPVSVEPIRQEFLNGTLQGLSINSVLVTDSAGRVVFSKSYDFLQKRQLDFPAQAQAELASEPWVRSAGRLSVPLSGIMLLPQGPVLIATCPILTTERKGPVRGVLVMTRNLDQAQVEHLKTGTRLSLDIELVSNSKLAAEFKAAGDSLRSNPHSIIVRPLQENTVAGYSILRDIHSRPALLLRVMEPREAFQRAKTSLSYFLGALCLVGLVFGFTTLLLLRYAVLDRLMRLNTEISRIGESKNLAQRVAVRGNDELAKLGGAINSALEALQKTDTQFRQLAENIHQVFWVKDAATEELIYISKAYESLWGLTPESIHRDAKSWQEAIHPDDRPIVAEMLEKQRRGHSGEAEYRVVGPDGVGLWIWDRFFSVVDEAGRLTQIVGLAENITEFKRAEQVLLRSQEELEARVRERTAELAGANEALRASKEHFRQLFATIPIPIWLYDESSGKFLEVNDSAVNQYGFSRQEFLQMTIEEMRPAAEVERLPQVPALLPSEGSVPLPRKHRVKDGRIIDVETHFDHVNFAGVPAVLVVAHDVTERNQMEVELRHGQKLQAVGGLASGIAHEINTPIQFVGDNVRFLHGAFSDLELLLEKYERVYNSAQNGGVEEQLLSDVKAAQDKADMEFLRKEIPTALTQTLDGIGRVATIVKALKEFSHVDWGHEKTAANLNLALESTIVVARNELKYVADVDTVFGELPSVMCYLGDLNQVFLNLLVNAAHSIGDVVKESGKKGRIRVETKEEADWVMVAIGDTGAGIPEAIRGRIFEPFFTTKGVGKGTGQGLALARAIVVEKHGGTLTFESEIGKGTTFYIRIPVSGVPLEAAR